MGEPVPEATQVQFRMVPPTATDEAPAIYANFVQVTISPHDFTLHLGWFALPALAEPPKKEVEVPVRSLLKVTLPLNLIRSLTHVLESQLRAWETAFGQPVPDQPIPPGPTVAASPEAQA